MNVFKKIMIVFSIFVFIFSVLLNVLLFSSSYGSLIIKYDKVKFSAMNAATVYENAELSHLLSKEKYGVQYTVTNIGEYDEIYASYYVDKDSKLSFYIKATKKETVGAETKDIIEEIYYKDNYLYLNNVLNSGEKTKLAAEAENALATYSMFALNLEPYLLTGEKIQSTKSKTKMSFSFSPFYLIGISYKHEDEAKNSYKYDYDLKGNLRKMEAKTKVDDKDVTTTLKVTYQNKKLSFPDLTEYVIQGA